MQGYIQRQLQDRVKHHLSVFPAVGLLGPRQCGKSTLARELLVHKKNSNYLDLENPADQRKLSDPELFFRTHKNSLVCLDEIQRLPELFPALRGILDRNRRNGQLLILGSASRELIRQSSETLAGRIGYLELTPFLHREIATNPFDNSRELVRGGFPRSILQISDQDSLLWRNNFIRTYLERDLPDLGFKIPSETLHRLWRMCAHSHGQQLNASRLGESLGVSHTTVRSYLELLSQTFMLRLLPPCLPNTGKRLTKSPKLYVRDSGILAALLGIESWSDLLGHPIFGSLWEGYIIENIMAEYPEYEYYYYRTATGVELDLIMEKGKHRFAVECKASAAPVLTKGFYTALADLQPEKTWIIAPVDSSYPVAKNVEVTTLDGFIKSFKECK